MQTEYEVLNKETGETAKVEAMKFGDGYVEVTTGDTTHRFENILSDGNLTNESENDNFVLRQVGTHLTPNNDGIVTDTGEEIPLA